MQSEVTVTSTATLVNTTSVPISSAPGVKCAFPLPANLVTTDNHLVAPYLQSMNLTVERQIANDLVVEVSYASKLSQKLEGRRFWKAANIINERTVK